MNKHHNRNHNHYSSSRRGGDQNHHTHHHAHAHQMKVMERKIMLRITIAFSLYVLITLATFYRLPDTKEPQFLRNYYSSSRSRDSGNLYHPNLGIFNNFRHLCSGSSGIEDENASNDSDKVSEAVNEKKMPSSDDFPLPIGSNDTEEILHPAYMYVPSVFTTIGSETLTVPRFWNPPNDKFGGNVRQYLGNNGQRLITREEATSIGSYYNGLETIYLAIASYRDPECVNTINSIYLRAVHPERIRVVVIDQRIEGDPHCVVPKVSCEDKPEQVLCKYKHLIDEFEMDAKLAAGPVFARHLGQRYYRGEYFAMQIDAHVRFIKDWDIDVVNQWKSANNEMAVLSTYLSDLNDSIDPETHEGIRPYRPILCEAIYEDEGPLRHLRLGQQPEGVPNIHGTPTLHPFWAAGFSFARGHFILQVPYDQHLPMVFQGEEINIGVRGFTYGYDYYTPEHGVCFHMYAILANKEKRDKVPHFWENNKLYQGGGAQNSMKRLNGIIGMGHPGDQYDHTDENLYGLGKVRTKEKFFKTYGIHPESQTVEGHLCTVVGKPLHTAFVQALRDDGMGLDYDKINYQFVDPNPEANNNKDKKQ